jgi:hypothetical protein
MLVTLSVFREILLTTNINTINRPNGKKPGRKISKPGWSARAQPFWKRKKHEKQLNIPV